MQVNIYFGKLFICVCERTMYSSRGSNAFGQQSYAAQSAAYGASVSFFSVNQSEINFIFSCVIEQEFLYV